MFYMRRFFIASENSLQKIHPVRCFLNKNVALDDILYDWLEVTPV